MKKITPHFCTNIVLVLIRKKKSATASHQPRQVQRRVSALQVMATRGSRIARGDFKDDNNYKARNVHSDDYACLTSIWHESNILRWKIKEWYRWIALCVLLDPITKRVVFISFRGTLDTDGLSDTVGKLGALKKLVIQYCSLTTLPSSLSGLANLSHLTLTRTRLKSIPDVIFAILSLQSLTISFNDLESVSPAIASLSSLTALDLCHNQLRELPIEIGQLNALQSLDVCHNALLFLPDEIGLLANLESLEVSNNRIRSLPFTIGNLTSLRYIDASMNALTCIPEEIGQVSSLKDLCLQRNRLVFLPSNISNLRELEYLNVSHNQLSELPMCLGEMTLLHTVLITANQILNRPSLPAPATMHAINTANCFLDYDYCHSQSYLPTTISVERTDDSIDLIFSDAVHTEVAITVDGSLMRSRWPYLDIRLSDAQDIVTRTRQLNMSHCFTVQQGRQLVRFLHGISVQMDVLTLDDCHQIVTHSKTYGLEETTLIRACQSKSISAKY